MRAICVFSGGLDSMLAAEAIRAQGVDVLALFFETPFFRAEKARESAHAMGLAFKVVDITWPHLEVVRHPKHGYGSNMNPCVDCHALMFRIAGEMLESEDAAFVVTGEVLGQRPMSQNKHAMNRIATESGLQDLLVRPLSARRLPLTRPEREGWIQREALFDFQGRSRKPQMELARRLQLPDYPSPGGGCLLTERGFSRRLKDLLGDKPDVEIRDLELLKLGRHFRIGPHAKLVVGRNKGENERIQSLSGKGDILLKSVSVPGPTVLLSGGFTEEAVMTAAAITTAYSNTGGRGANDVSVSQDDREIAVLTGPVHGKGEFKGLMI
jgi:tRNA-uridine 2-sulfurtransferase